jgi:hypothetical protein
MDKVRKPSNSARLISHAQNPYTWQYDVNQSRHTENLTEHTALAFRQVLYWMHDVYAEMFQTEHKQAGSVAKRGFSYANVSYEWLVISDNIR